MALEGKIIDFGVADILQLISQQQKTGILIVERFKDSAEIIFWNGMILTAHYGVQPEGEEIGKQLIMSGHIGEGQLQKAMEIQDTNFRHLGEILVELGAISKELFDQILHNSIYDTFSEIFQWREGNYIFHPKPIEFNEKVFVPLGLEHILLDVLRMIDEWPIVLKKVPSLGTLFRKTEQSLSGEKGLPSREQMMVYQLVDGQNKVRDIVDRSLFGKFTTSKLLMELLEAGYIEVVPEKRVLPFESRKEKYQVVRRMLIMGCYGVGMLLVALLLAFSPPDFKRTLSLFFSSPSAPALSTLNQLRLQKIKNALQIYFWQQGKYPDDLNALVVAQMLHREEITSYRGEPFSYRSDGTTYQLRE